MHAKTHKSWTEVLVNFLPHTNSMVLYFSSICFPFFKSHWFIVHLSCPASHFYLCPCRLDDKLFISMTIFIQFSIVCKNCFYCILSVHFIYTDDFYWTAWPLTNKCFCFNTAHFSTFTRFACGTQKAQTILKICLEQKHLFGIYLKEIFLNQNSAFNASADMLQFKFIIYFKITK